MLVYSSPLGMLMLKLVEIIGSDDIEMFFGALSELAKNVTFTVYFFDKAGN